MESYKNLLKGNKVIDIKPLENGVQITTEADVDNILSKTESYICLEDEWDRWFRVSLKQSDYTSCDVYVMAPKGSTNFTAILEKAVEFATENELPFEYCELYEAQDNGYHLDDNGNLVDEDGTDTDMVEVGNVWIPSEFSIEEVEI